MKMTDTNLGGVLNEHILWLLDGPGVATSYTQAPIDFAKLTI